MPPAYSHSGVNKFDGTCLLEDRKNSLNLVGPIPSRQTQLKVNRQRHSPPSSLSPGNSRKGCSCPPDSWVIWQVGTWWLFLVSAWSQATCKTDPSATSFQPRLLKITAKPTQKCKPRKRAPKMILILTIHRGSYGHHCTPGRKYEADKCSTLFPNTCFPVRISARAHLCTTNIPIRANFQMHNARSFNPWLTRLSWVGTSASRPTPR